MRPPRPLQGYPPEIVASAIVEVLKEYRRQHKKGDKAALMRALNLCAECRIAMPEWVAANFHAAYRRVAEYYEANSWDHVFGKPHPAGTKLRAQFKRRQLQPLVYNAIKARHLHDGEPLDEALFESVGKRAGVSMSTAREWYYAEEKERAD
jgi:hypothetical protein